MKAGNNALLASNLSGLKRARAPDDPLRKSLSSFVQRVSRDELTACLFLRNGQVDYLVIGTARARFIGIDAEIIECPLQKWLAIRHHYVAHFRNARHVVLVIGNGDDDGRLSFENFPSVICLTPEPQLTVCGLYLIDERHTGQPQFLRQESTGLPRPPVACLTPDHNQIETTELADRRGEHTRYRERVRVRLTIVENQRRLVGLHRQCLAQRIFTRRRTEGKHGNSTAAEPLAKL